MGRQTRAKRERRTGQCVARLTDKPAEAGAAAARSPLWERYSLHLLLIALVGLTAYANTFS